jgi:hypothetical protein
MSSLAVGGPLGATGSWGWDWWALFGAFALFVMLQVGRRRLPLFLQIAVSVVGGLILSDLTRAWGVVPVWGTFLLVALALSLIGGRRRSQV